MTEANMVETAPLIPPKAKKAPTTPSGSAASGTGENIYTALIAAKGDMAALQKTADNLHYRSRYIDLESLIAATDDALNKHGLVVTALLERDEFDNPILRTILTYAKDPSQTIESVAKLATKDMLDAQKMGSAITYFRRYSLQALLNLAAEDDDGNAASGLTTTTKTAAKSSAPAEKKFNTPAPGKDPSPAQKSALSRMLTEAGYGSSDAKQEASKKKFGKTLDQLDSRDVSIWLDELKSAL